MNTVKKKKKINDFKVLENCKAISNELRLAQQIIALELEDPFVRALSSNLSFCTWGNGSPVAEAWKRRYGKSKFIHYGLY